MEILHRCCAGLDVHQKTVVACVRRVDPDGRPTEHLRSFATTTAALLELADWLAEAGADRVAMESTGVYWEPVYQLLEDRFAVVLVNPQQVKRPVEGRKTDVGDARWLAQLLQFGLVSPSFVPPRPVRELRDLTRRRTQLVRQRAAVVNRIQKVLESANIKLAAVVTDVLGVSGRAILAALARGETDPARLAALARGRLRRRAAALEAALRGHVTGHHQFLLTALLDEVRHLEDLIARFTARVEEQMAPFAAAQDRLTTIPGVGRTTAEVIVAEVGADMTRFPTAAHLASWAGMSPGNDVSAGKRRSGKTTKGSRWLRAALVQAAWAASRTRGRGLSAVYRRWSRRLGRKRAIVAVGHKILVIAYELLKDGTTYEDRFAPARAA